MLTSFGCGVKIRTSKIEAEVIHKFDLEDAFNFCEQNFQTNEEVEACKQSILDSLANRD